MITSRQNQFIKKIKSLKDKKERDNTNTFIVESIKLCKEVLESNLSVLSVVGTKKGLSGLEISPLIKVEEVSEDVFCSISQEKTPQGVLAVVEKPLIEDVVIKQSILLDGVGDPSNVGAIIRTAVASGFDKIFLTDDSADVFSVKSVRASMGGIFKIPVEYIKREQIKSFISSPLIIADMGGESAVNYKPPKEFCLVIGNEGNGVSKEVKSLAKHIVSIPMKKGTESLNASVSAGILMYLLKINNEEIN